MIEPNKDTGGRGQAARLNKSGQNTPGDPDWTSGLKRLYDSVVEEPMPDSFRDLLAKLDTDQNR